MTTKKEQKKGWKSWGPGLIAFFAFFGSKFKFLLPLLKLGKFGGTIWSMALMVWAYAIFYPWFFAIGVVVMIFIHEMGHVLAAKRKGIPVSAPAFIPFVGALITMRKQPLNAEEEAYLAFGGPLIGTVGALGAYGLGVALQSPALLSVAQIGFFLNLINLIPIHPLDGGRIVTAISRWLWVVGLIGGLIVILYLGMYIFLIFWAMFAWELYKKYVRKKKPIEEEQETTLVISTAEENFVANGLPIPATSHRRELTFIQSCDLRTRTELLHVYYPGIGALSSAPVTFDIGLVKQVTLIETKHKSEYGIVEMRLALRYQLYSEQVPSVFQGEEYYQVPTRTRFIYGVSYLGLAAFLAWMMLVTFNAFNSPGLVG
ncbi:hypothetical protein BEP19_00220 [Ammoniphilus oxalaticus]|uniref:Peptidase M50 domain-containing protein n=1 Tax=Ammoniphilus oxalaticus TaxID=66863 RepID=A0A419SR64_9BACL|nr:site-2 protease family protein [Ammoniphilus oxalaticus]RKD27036.1 hypothetical protein BEP19_00220 [Ammoniphilus oxalaticus]